MKTHEARTKLLAINLVLVLLLTLLPLSALAADTGLWDGAAALTAGTAQTIADNPGYYTFSPGTSGDYVFFTSGANLSVYTEADTDTTPLGQTYADKTYDGSDVFSLSASTTYYILAADAADTTIEVNLLTAFSAGTFSATADTNYYFLYTATATGWYEISAEGNGSMLHVGRIFDNEGYARKYVSTGDNAVNVYCISGHNYCFWFNPNETGDYELSVASTTLPTYSGTATMETYDANFYSFTPTSTGWYSLSGFTDYIPSYYIDPVSSELVFTNMGYILQYFVSGKTYYLQAHNMSPAATETLSATMETLDPWVGTDDIQAGYYTYCVFTPESTGLYTFSANCSSGTISTIATSETGFDEVSGLYQINSSSAVSFKLKANTLYLIELHVLDASTVTRGVTYDTEALALDTPQTVSAGDLGSFSFTPATGGQYHFYSFNCTPPTLSLYDSDFISYTASGTDLSVYLDGGNTYYLQTQSSFSCNIKASATTLQAVTMADWVYGGTAATPALSATLPDDYSVVYSYKLTSAEDPTYYATKPSAAGDYTVMAVIYNGEGAIAEIVTDTFAISAIGIATSDFTVNEDDSEYTGSAITKSVTSALTLNTDYTVTYSDNTNVGEATITITGAGNYSGTLTYHFNITQKTLATSDFTVNEADSEYTGSAITKEITSELTADTDYTVAYSDNTTVGEATITITGAGNCTGTLTYHFTITTMPTTLTADAVTMLLGGAEPELTYVADPALAEGDALTGALSHGDVTVAGTYDIASTLENSNYDITFVGADKLTVVNNATAAITGITKADLSEALAEELENEGKYTVTMGSHGTYDNTYTVAIKGTAALTAYASSDSAQGTHKWVAIMIGGLAVNDADIGITDVWYSFNETNWYRVTADDVIEADTLNNGAGTQFVYWIDSASIGDGKMLYLATDDSGADEIAVTITYKAYSAPAPVGGASPTTTPTGTVSTSTGAVKDSEIAAAITAAKNDSSASGIRIESGASSATLSAAAIAAISEANQKMTVSTETGSATFNADGMAALSSQLSLGDSLKVSVEKTDVDSSNFAVVSDANVIMALDVSITAGADEIQANFGTLIISMNVGTALAGKTVDVLHLHDDGTYDIIQATVDANGNISFGVNSLSTFVVMDEQNVPVEYIFDDVDADSWFVDYVQEVYTAGIMTGADADTFGAWDNMTREQLVTTLYRMAGSPAVTGDMMFTDVVDGAYYADAIAWAYGAGIVNGVDAAIFGVGLSVSREDAVTILYRYSAYVGKTVSGGTELAAYNDADSVSAYAREAMMWAVGNGIVNGTTATTLSPDGAITRAQVAAILARF